MNKTPASTPTSTAWPRWYLSFHGGEAAEAWNNLHVYSAEGELLGKALDYGDLPDHVNPRELRGFAFGPDGDLYVANAYRERSEILRFHGSLNSAGRHPFRDVFSEAEREEQGLAHPFHVAFGPDEHLYVPSQDTDIVGRYYGPKATGGDPGAPMPLPPSLAQYPPDKMRPGAFVPSARHVPTGLKAVRHILFGPDGQLYVADREANRVQRYDGVSGELIRAYTSPHLTTPIHMAHRPVDGALLVGSRDRNAVVAIDPETGEVKTLVHPGAGGLKEPGGLAIGPDGLLYVASRTGREILRFDPVSGESAGKPFLTGLSDNPEFLLFAPGPHQRAPDSLGDVDT